MLNNGGIYAIWDNISMMIIGQLMIFKHPAAAIRTFSDIAQGQDSQVGRHINDYDLVQLGYLTEQGEITPLLPRETIITGKAWAAAQAPSPAGGPELVREAK